jgi:hypothetical protein
MTTRQWQIITGFSVLFCAVALGFGLLTKTRAERDAMTATAHLDSVTAQLDTARLHLADAEALARAGLKRSQKYQATIDSIWRVAMARRDSLHRPARTPVLVDVRDTIAVVRELAALTQDLTAARADAAAGWAAADALQVAAVEHARDDSVRFAEIVTSVAAADTSVQFAGDDARAAREAIRPRWWKRLARGVVATTKAATLIAIGYGAGRR